VKRANRARGALAPIFILLPLAAFGQTDLPTFARFTVLGTQGECRSQFKAIPTHNRGTLSLLRSVDGGPTTLTDYLVAGQGYGKHVRQDCSLTVELDKPLVKPMTLLVDVSGVEQKDPEAVMRLDLTVGPQKHVIGYTRSRVVPNIPGTEIKRFKISVPAGFKRLLIRASGYATSLNGTDLAILGFEAVDLCFVGIDGCGVDPALPAPAAPASAPAQPK
jgi:hypothetical protein